MPKAEKVLVVGESDAQASLLAHGVTEGTLAFYKERGFSYSQLLYIAGRGRPTVLKTAVGILENGSEFKTNLDILLGLGFTSDDIVSVLSRAATSQMRVELHNWTCEEHLALISDLVKTYNMRPSDIIVAMQECNRSIDLVEPLKELMRKKNESLLQYVDSVVVAGEGGIDVDTNLLKGGFLGLEQEASTFDGEDLSSLLGNGKSKGSQPINYLALLDGGKF